MSTTSPEWRGVRGFLLGLIDPGRGAPFVWALAEMIWGISLVRRR